jgi:hypothetical protein
MKTKIFLVTIAGSLLGLTSLGLLVCTFFLDKEWQNYYAQNFETATKPGAGLWVLMFLLIGLVFFIFKGTFLLRKDIKTKKKEMKNGEIIKSFFGLLLFLLVVYVFFVVLISAG